MNRIEAIIMQIAAENNTTAEAVRKEISAAIEAGMNSPDSNIRELWRSMSKTGGTPTPEEAICYLSKAAEKKFPAH